jgi:hypothetical protein
MLKFHAIRRSRAKRCHWMARKPGVALAPPVQAQNGRSLSKEAPRYCEAELDLPPFPRVGDWLTHCASRPAFQG